MDCEEKMENILEKEYSSIEGLIALPTGQSDIEHNAYLKLNYEYSILKKKKEKCVKNSLTALILSSVISVLISLHFQNKAIFLSIWIICVLSIVYYIISLSYKCYKFESLLGINDNVEVKEDDQV